MGLPQGARVWRAVGNDAAWTDETHMLANVVDVVTWGNYQRAGGKKAGPKPDAIKRPSEQQQDKERRGRIEARARRAKARINQN